MLVSRQVLVKSVVTEEFRRRLTVRLRESLDKIDASLQQLEHEGDRYLEQLKTRDPGQAEAFERKLRLQKKRQQTIRSKLSAELDRVEKLDVGSEYTQGRLQGFVEIREGDILPDVSKPAEILLRDGTVLEIRHG